MPHGYPSQPLIEEGKVPIFVRYPELMLIKQRKGGQINPYKNETRK